MGQYRITVYVELRPGQTPQTIRGLRQDVESFLSGHPEVRKVNGEVGVNSDSSVVA